MPVDERKFGMRARKTPQSKMPPANNERKTKEQLRDKDREIAELKELLAESESEIRELNDFQGFKKPKPGILESTWLNKLIKRTAFLLICAVIVLIGLYPWLFKDRILENGELDRVAVEEGDLDGEELGEAEGTKEDVGGEVQTPSEGEPEETDDSAEVEQDIFKSQQILIVESDLGWLNVRTEPNVETGKIITKINSGEEYKWLEETENNWYKVKIDDEGNTGYVSGEYVIIK